MARLLTKMKISEISAVNRGAGEGVKVLLTKRDPLASSKDASKAAKKASKNALKRSKAELKAERHQLEIEKQLDPEVEEYLKREFSADQREHLASSGAAMPGGGYPIESKEDLSNAIRAVGRAENPGLTKRHIISRAHTLGASDQIPDKWKAKQKKRLAKAFAALAETVTKSEGGEDFNTEMAEMQSLDYGEGIIEAVHDSCKALKHSIESIMDDGDTGNKGGAIRESFSQFIDHVADLAPESDVAKVFKGFNQDVEETDMTKMDQEDFNKIEEVIAKAMTSVGQSDTGSPLKNKPDWVKAEEDREKELANQKGKEDSKAGAATNLSKQLEDTQKNLETVQQESQVWKSRFDALLKMQPAHRDYLFHKNNDMDEDAKKKFADMKDGDRDDEVKKNSIESKIEKAMEALPEPVRKALEDGKMAQEALLKMAGERELMTFTKKAHELRMGPDFAPHFVALHKSSPEAFEAVVKHIEALTNQVGTSKLFAEFGSADVGGTTGGSAYDRLMAKAAELQKSAEAAGNRLSEAQAFSKVYTDPANRELVTEHKRESPIRAN